MLDVLVPVNIFFGRASRALGLSPTFGRRAPNFREISRALGRAELFYKLSRKSDPGDSRDHILGSRVGIPSLLPRLIAALMGHPRFFLAFLSALYAITV